MLLLLLPIQYMISVAQLLKIHNHLLETKHLLVCPISKDTHAFETNFSTPYNGHFNLVITEKD